MRALIVAGAVAGFLVALGMAPSWGQSTPAPLRTPDQQGSASLGNAASAPMHDLNIFRQRIPPVLLAAMVDPYARPPRTCAALDARVAELDAAMGPDLDSPDAHARDKGMGLPLLHALSDLLLPFSGAVRTLSGAQKHDQQVLAAIIAGGVRRGYLKGLGEAHGCGPPATPRHFLRTPPPAVEEGRNRLQYSPR